MPYIKITRFVPLFILNIFCALLIGQNAFAEEEITFKTTKIVDGLYMIEGVGGFAGGNVVVSTGADGTVLVDDAIPSMLDKLNVAVKAVTDRPLDFLINTHLHQDHTGNNAYFGEEGAHIVAHANVRDRLKVMEVKDKEGNKALLPSSALPVISFEHAISFHLNGGHIQVLHLEKAHTDGDSVVHFEDANVIHTGDVLFSGLYPFIDLDNGGSVDGYIAAQQALYTLANKETVIIPGHGPVSDKEALKSSYSMLKKAKKAVAKLQKKGMTEDEVVAANPLQKFDKDWSWGFINTEKMTRTLYKDMLN